MGACFGLLINAWVLAEVPFVFCELILFIYLWILICQQLLVHVVFPRFYNRQTLWQKHISSMHDSLLILKVNSYFLMCLDLFSVTSREGGTYCTRLKSNKKYTLDWFPLDHLGNKLWIQPTLAAWKLALKPYISNLPDIILWKCYVQELKLVRVGLIGHLQQIKQDQIDSSLWVPPLCHYLMSCFPSTHKSI